MSEQATFGHSVNMFKRSALGLSTRGPDLVEGEQ
jgi:hypothetical protein